MNMNQRNGCAWTIYDNGVWETSCGNAFVFNDGAPRDNGFLFCPYCGHPLEHPGPLTKRLKRERYYDT